MDSGRGMVVIFIDGPIGSNKGLSAKEQLGILSDCVPQFAHTTPSP